MTRTAADNFSALVLTGNNGNLQLIWHVCENIFSYFDVDGCEVRLMIIS
jgi:hypothetical protein